MTVIEQNTLRIDIAKATIANYKKEREIYINNDPSYSFQKKDLFFNVVNICDLGIEKQEMIIKIAQRAIDSELKYRKEVLFETT